MGPSVPQCFLYLSRKLSYPLVLAEFRTLWDPEHVPARSEKTRSRVGTRAQRISVPGSLEEHAVGYRPGGEVGVFIKK